MKKIRKIIISSITLCTVLFSGLDSGYGECLYSKSTIPVSNDMEDDFTVCNLKNDHDREDEYKKDYNNELSVLYTNIKKKEQNSDVDTAFLYDTIIYNTFIVDISESIHEYSHDSKVRKISKNIIKTMDESLMRSGILFDILREIPEDNLQKEKQYEEECYEFCLSKVQDMSNAGGTNEDIFLEAVKCHHQCIIKICESITNLSTRKEVKRLPRIL